MLKPLGSVLNPISKVEKSLNLGESYIQTSTEQELRKRMGHDGYENFWLDELLLEQERRFAPINNFQKGNGEFFRKVDDMATPDSYKKKQNE